jgi:hypothetical protein
VKHDSLDRSLEKLDKNSDIKIASECIRVNNKTLIKTLCVITDWRILKQRLRKNSKNLGIEKGKLN